MFYINKVGNILARLFEPGTSLLEDNKDFFLIDNDYGKEYIVDTYWDIREKVYQFTLNVDVASELADNLYFQNLAPTSLVVYTPDSTIPKSIDLLLSSADCCYVLYNNFLQGIYNKADNSLIVLMSSNR